MKNTMLFLFLATASISAHADDIGIGCGKTPSQDSKVIVSFGGTYGDISSENASLTYKGKEASKKAQYFTIKNKKDETVRYIVKDGSYTFVFSNLAKCGDSMELPADYAQLSITKTDRTGKKQVVDKLLCNCDID